MKTGFISFINGQNFENMPADVANLCNSTVRRGSQRVGLPALNFMFCFVIFLSVIKKFQSYFSDLATLIVCF